MNTENSAPNVPQPTCGEPCRTIKKRRGGQPGNHNALKHGYFAKELAEKYQTLLDQMPPAATPLEAALQKQRLKMTALIEIDPLNVRVVSAAGRCYLNLQRAIALTHAMETDESFRQQFTEWLGQYGFVPSFPSPPAPRNPPLRPEKNENAANIEISKNRKIQSVPAIPGTTHTRHPLPPAKTLGTRKNRNENSK